MCLSYVITLKNQTFFKQIFYYYGISMMIYMIRIVPTAFGGHQVIKYIYIYVLLKYEMV